MDPRRRLMPAAAAVALLLAALSALAPALAQRVSASPVLAPGISRFSSTTQSEPPAPWRVVTLPKIPRHTQFEIVQLDGARVLQVRADGSYANLLHRLDPPSEGAPILRWRWRLEQPNLAADLTRKDSDDTAVRVCVLFDVPLSQLRFGDRTKLRLGRALFDPELPAAAICYVWDTRLTANTWLPNAYTDRVQMLVLRSTASDHRVREWYDEQRDLRADFAVAFPYESLGGARPLPPILALGISGDGDNTGGRSLAYVGDITLTAP